MAKTSEKRLLQAIVALACLVPLTYGSFGVLLGPRWLRGVPLFDVPVDLDSHFHYLSGIFLGVGIAFTTCVPDIEIKGPRFRLLGSFVVLGGLSRLFSLIVDGVPSHGQQLGLCMELIVVPCLLLWQASLAKRWP